MVCLGNALRSFCRKSFCCFWDCIQVLHFGLFCWLWWVCHFLLQGISWPKNRISCMQADSLLTEVWGKPLWLATSSVQWFLRHLFFFFFSVLESLVGLHWTGELQLFHHKCLVHRLEILWCWIACLGNELRSFCHFWDCTQVLHFNLFCWLWGYSVFFLRNSCPQ